jgi:RNA polymerase sigma factor (sigma-70 family)
MVYEVSFYWLLLEVLAGRRPIADLVAHEVFLSRGEMICRFITGEQVCKWDELFQDVCVKVLTFGHKLCPGNIPDEDAFFKWLFVVALNRRRDIYRRNVTLRRREVSLCDISIEELLIIDPAIGPEGDCFFNEFEAFIQTLPENRRRAMALRQEGYSYEKIAEILNRGDIRCTNVTVRKWCRDGLAAFFDDGRVPAVVKAARV